MRLIGVLILLTLGGCTAPMVEKSLLLEPVVLDVHAAPAITMVDAASELAQVVRPGDQLLRIGDRPVGSYQELGALLSDPKVFGLEATVVTAAGDSRLIPMESLFPGTDGVAYVSWVEPGSTVSAGPFTNPDGQAQVSAGAYAGQIFAAVAARLWLTMPRLLEVQLSVTAAPDCSACGLAGLAVMDLPHNSWVHPIAMEQVAWAVLPDLGAPGQVVAVPPPTPAGGTAYSSTHGTINAFTYGNQTHGNYAANTTTSYVPTYDYTATNAAYGHNLGVALRNEQIQNQNRARHEFVAKRSGNLKLDFLNPGETVVGHVFFALPAGFEGPFGIQVGNSTGETGWVRFNLPK